MILTISLGAVLLAGSIAAVALRNLVHCALALAVALTALAALYLMLGAQFVGFAQVLIYVGAVAILVVFAILLTHSNEPGSSSNSGAGPPVEPTRGPVFSTTIWGVTTFLGVFAVLTATILKSSVVRIPPGPAPTATVRQIGEDLMTRYILPLEVLGLLLTAALIGAVIIALRDSESATPPK